MTDKRGFTLLEMTVASVIVVIVMYGAGIMYLNYFKSLDRGRDKLQLQEDATFAAEQIVRGIRKGGTVNVRTGPVRIGVHESQATTPVDSFVAVTSGGQTYLNSAVLNYAVSNTRLVQSRLDAVTLTPTGNVWALTLTLADTSGNKVTTVAQAVPRNAP